jgi:hypothetical protein
MLCDKAGKPLPPSECRLLRAWIEPCFATRRYLVLVEPSARALPPGAALAPGTPLSAARELFTGGNVITDREVVLEGGLQQVCAGVVVVAGSGACAACVQVSSW